MAISRTATFTSKRRATFGDSPTTRLLLDSSEFIPSMESQSIPVVTVLGRESFSHTITVIAPSPELFGALYKALAAVQHDEAFEYPERIREAIGGLLSAPVVEGGDSAE